MCSGGIVLLWIMILLPATLLVMKVPVLTMMLENLGKANAN